MIYIISKKIYILYLLYIYLYISVRNNYIIIYRDLEPRVELFRMYDLDPILGFVSEVNNC